MFVFLNCFLWNSSSNICNAENINELTTHKAPTNEKFIGAEITSLNSWKKCSIFSWQTLETYFKQASKKRLGEIKWKINEIINSGRSYGYASTLIEKISELRKCRLDPKVNLEGVILSGIRSYSLETTFPQIYSKTVLLENTHKILKSGGLNYNKFQNGESCHSLGNYFPGLKLLTDRLKTIPTDSGKGFTTIKFFSEKGSPFFRKIVEQEYSNGFNVILDSNKAGGILIKDNIENLGKTKFSIKLNKEAIHLKPKKQTKKYGMKISNLLPCENIMYVNKKRFNMGTRFWNKRCYLKNLGVTKKINITTMMKDNNLNYNQKIQSPLISSTIKNNGIWKADNFLRTNSIKELRYLEMLFQKSLNSKKRKSIIPTYASFNMKKQGSRSLIKEFAHLKKKKQLSILISKDKFIRILKKKKEKRSRLWEAKKFDQSFRLHTFCVQSKKFLVRKTLHKTHYNPVFPLDKVFYDKNNNSGKRNNSLSVLSTTFLLELIKRSNKFLENTGLKNDQQFSSKININKNFKNFFRPIKVTELLHFDIDPKKDTNQEILNFTDCLCTHETKDWKTSISFLNKYKMFKDPKLLNFLGNILRSGQEIPKSTIESQKFYRKSADLGNANSSTLLATYFMKGTGVKKSKSLAFLIFSKTAHMGIPKGIYNVIIMLKHGIGVRKDSLRSLRILENSKNLITKERRSFKKFKKVNKNGFFKTLFSSTRIPNEICLISFFLESLTSPITSYLSTLILERSSLIASDMNLTNLSEKKGSVVCRKKLKNIFLENRQPYLFQEQIKGLSPSVTSELTQSILKWVIGISCLKDYKLFKNISKNEIIGKNIFHSSKIIQNNLTILFNDLFYFTVLWSVRFLNFMVFFLLKGEIFYYLFQ